MNKVVRRPDKAAPHPSPMASPVTGCGITTHSSAEARTSETLLFFVVIKAECVLECVAHLNQTGCSGILPVLQHILFLSLVVSAIPK